MRLLSLFAALALVASPSVAFSQTQNDGGAQAAKIAAERGYPLPQGKPVVDAANVIPDDQEAALVSKILAYENRTKHQLVVTTVPSLKGEDVEEYSVNYFRAVGIGGKDRDDGTLILISPSEHKGWITTGRGMETILTDAQASDIWHDTIVPKFKDGDIPGGIEAGADEVMKRTTPLTPAEVLMQKREDERQHARAAAAWAKFWDFVLTVLGIGAVGGAIFGTYWKVTAPARRRKREEREAAEQAAIDQRMRQMRAEAEERDRIERERVAEEKRKREAMLAAMTPAKRQAFLDKERRDAEAAAAAAAAAEAARQKRQREADEAAAQRRRDDDSYSSSSWSSSSSDSGWSSSSSDSSWSGGGGDTGGGGAGGSW